MKFIFNLIIIVSVVLLFPKFSYSIDNFRIMSMEEMSLIRGGCVGDCCDSCASYEDGHCEKYWVVDMYITIKWFSISSEECKWYRWYGDKTSQCSCLHYYPPYSCVQNMAFVNSCSCD